MSDRILLTMPSSERMRGVATLVLGGIGSRLDLPYERTDDLQLAVVSALDATDSGDVSIEIDAADESIVLTMGPLRTGAGEDEGLGRVLSRLVDDVRHDDRDGADWLTLSLAR